jgi:hypothetical protein
MGRALTIATVLLAVLAGPALAQDAVTGSAFTGDGRASIEFTFDAHSGPSGQNPTGTVHINAFLGDIGVHPVTCLSVSGNRATMHVDFPDDPPGNPTSIPDGAVISVQDGPDQLRYGFVDELPATCPVSAEPLPEINSGNIVVTDERPLRWAIKACIFERVAIGSRAFREKYGVGRFHLFAMLRCIHLRADR